MNRQQHLAFWNKAKTIPRKLLIAVDWIVQIVPIFLIGWIVQYRNWIKTGDDNWKEGQKWIVTFGFFAAIYVLSIPMTIIDVKIIHNCWMYMFFIPFCLIVYSGIRANT